MDNDSEDLESSEVSKVRGKDDSYPGVSSRRRFTRQALVSGAIIASLGNRAAWGQTIQGECISVNVFMSLAPVGGGLRFASLSPAKREWGAKIQRMQDDVLNSSDMVGTYAGYSEKLEVVPQFGTDGKVCVMKTPPTRIGTKNLGPGEGLKTGPGGNFVEDYNQVSPGQNPHRG